MTKNTKRNRETTTFDIGKVFDLLLAFILVLAICLKGSYFPESYLPVLAATGIWLLIRLPAIELPVLWKDRVFVLLGIVFLCYILACFYAVGNRYIAILETLKIAAGLLFFLAVRLSRNRAILYRGIVTGCFLLAVSGLLAYIGIVDFPQAVLRSGRVLRLQSLLQYANVMALFMGIAYFLSVYLDHHSQSVTEKRNYYFYGYLFLLTLFWTCSRGGITVFLVFLLIWIFLQTQPGQGGWRATLEQVVAAALFAFLIAMLVSYNHPVMAFLLLVLLMGMMFLLWNRPADPMGNTLLLRLALLVPAVLLIFGGIGLLAAGKGSIILSRTGTFLERIITMQDAGTVLQGYLCLGIGPGSWSSLQFKYQSAEYTVRYLHNGFLQLAMDAGPLALLALILAVLIYYMHEVRSFRATGDCYELLPGLALGFILLHSLIDIGFSFTGLLLIMAVLFGSQPLPYHPEKKNTQAGQLSLSAPKLLLAVVLLIIIGVAGYVWKGEILFSQGKAAVRCGALQEGSALFRDSVHYRPGDAEVFLALAQTTLRDQAGNEDTISYLEQARRLDQYEPRYVEELINLAYQRGDLAEVYRYSRIFMKMKPRDQQGYRKAGWSLHEMYARGEIDRANYEQSKADIQSELEQSNKTLHPLAKYLHKDD